MIYNNEIVQLLRNPASSNIMCIKHEFRADCLVNHIVDMANTVENYGYILIGVTSSPKGYDIVGLASGMELKGSINIVLGKLTVKPKIEYKNVIISNKRIYVLKVYKADGGTSLYDKKIENPYIKKFIADLCGALEKMQKNQLYIDASEDQRNDYVRDILQTLKYDVKDQTRTGLSNNGKASGQADLKVIINDDFETIVEALNLTNLAKDYLDTHIDKIYKYDLNGNIFNCCITYAQVSDFATFWAKYCNHIKNHKFKYPLILPLENDIGLNLPIDIKVMVSKHNRSGKITLLYHICVKIQVK